MLGRDRLEANLMQAKEMESHKSWKFESKRSKSKFEKKEEKMRGRKKYIGIGDKHSDGSVLEAPIGPVHEASIGVHRSA